MTTRRLIPAVAAALLLAGCALPSADDVRPLPSDQPAASPTPEPVARVTPPASVPPAALPPALHDAGGLDPRMVAAFKRARSAAGADGIELTVTSSYRSAAQQQQVLDDFAREKGSVEAAREYALLPWQSMHVRGLAIDVGSTFEAQEWLWNRQERFGLCRRYVNEPWHFELKDPGTSTCPPMFESPSAEFGS